MPKDAKENPLLLIDALIDLMKEVNPESLSCLDGEVVRDRIKNY